MHVMPTKIKIIAFRCVSQIVQQDTNSDRNLKIPELPLSQTILRTETFCYVSCVAIVQSDSKQKNFVCDSG